MPNASRPFSAAAELQGLTALITGASGGIGSAVAQSLARAGADVVLHACQRREVVDRMAAEMAGDRREALVLQADLSRPEAAARLVAQAADWKGGLDIVVNAAGADILTGPRKQASYEERLACLWAVDVLGTLRICRCVPDRMPPSGGVIITIGWDQADLGQAGESGELFAAAKGAVMAYSRSLARSLAPQLRVNCVAPGWVRTAWGASVGGYWDRRAQGESLLERWGTPEDVAQVVQFLVSPRAAFVNGQVIAVNGGVQPWPRQLTHPPRLPPDRPHHGASGISTS